MFIIRNATVLNGNFKFIQAEVEVDGARIRRIAPHLDGAPVLDAQGAYLLPGLVNIHTHGAVGYDTASCDYDGLNAMSRYWASTGTTAFLPTTTTALYEDTLHAMETIASAAEQGVDGAEILGVNMEGPYLSELYRGAHRPDWLRSVREFDFDAMQRAAGGRIKLTTIAPETDGALAFIESYGRAVHVSLGHTGADYETCMAAFEAGATQVTHLFNAMPPLHHRRKSLIAAAFESGAMVELIGDGLHVSPTMAKMAYAMFGPEKIILINDSMNAAGLSEGEYEFCGMHVTVQDGVARQEDGTICGGIAPLLECVKNMISWGVPLEEAVRMASYNPACAVRAQERVGSIAPGKDADLLLVSKELELWQVFIKGKAFKYE